MTFWLLAVGFLSLLAQVVLLRELNVAFYGSELIYILALGGWLLGTATGALLGRRPLRPTPARVRRLLLVLAVVFPLTLAEVRGARLLWGAVPGAYLPFPRQIAALLVALLPVGALLGQLFRLAAGLAAQRGRTLAWAYAVESAGGLAGGVLATLLLEWSVPNLTAGLLCGLLAAGAVFWPWRGRSRGLTGGAAAVALLLLAALAAGRGLDRRLTTWDHPHLAATRDTPYGRVTVTDRDGQLSVFVNDALAFENEGTAAEEYAQLAALQCAEPESLLVLGGGVEGLVGELLQHRPAALDYVELNRDLLDLVRSRLPPAVEADLAAPAVRVTVAEPRRFLARAGRYDLILIGMPEPDSGQANRFYTREFFQICAAHLRPGGVLALRLRAAENLWSPQLVRRTASIARALREVFPDLVALPGTTVILLASPAPLPRDPGILARRWEDRGIVTRLVSPAYIRYLYTNDRFAEVAGLLQESRAPVNLDLRPVCYQSTLLLWLARFFPALALLDWPARISAWPWRAPVLWLGALLLLGLLLLARRGEGSRRAARVGIAGGVGMVLETVLILAYQVRSGILFQDLGLLLTAFMGGLALGALLLERWGQRRRQVLDITAGPPAGAVPIPGWLGALCLGGLALLGAGTAGLVAAGLAGRLLVAALLLLLAGTGVAAVFAQASLASGRDQAAAIAPLYAADLAGGCLGSLLASLLLVPLAGLGGTALLAVLITLLGLLLV